MMVFSYQKCSLDY